MQSSKLYSDIVNEPSETDLWQQYNVKELISLTFKTAENNVVNFKMLQIVLYLMAHELNILEQVVEIKEEDRSKAIEKLQQYMASDLDLSSIDKSIFLEEMSFKYGNKNKSEAKKHLDTLTADDSKHDRKETHKIKPTKVVTDDASSLGGSKHSGEKKTKKEKITQSVKSKKEEKYDDNDETLTLDDSDQIEQKKEVKGKDKMATRTKKRRPADDASILDESEDDEIQTDKKGEHEMRSKQEKSRKPDDTYDTYESENYEKRADKEVKSKTSKADDDVHDILSSNKSEDSRIQKSKGKMKSIRSQNSVDTVTLDESEDDETMLDKKSKERLEVKTKEDKTAHSTRSHSGKQRDESKSEAEYKQKKMSKDTISVGSQNRRSSIELATRSQFEVLVSYVKKLLQQTGPVPMPIMPDNKKLKDDLAKGSASLPVAMEAMQINARVIAAETALTRMADLLNQLAAVGVFPPETLNLITKSQKKHDEISPISYRLDDNKEGVGQPDDVSSLARASTFATQSKSSVLARAPSQKVLVTQADMIDAVKQSRADMLKKIHAMTAKTWTSIEKACVTATVVGDSLETVTGINTRIDNFESLALDSAEQLSGFKTGLNTQLQSIQEQMLQFGTELKDCFAVFKMSDKKESPGVIEIRKGYENIMAELHRLMNKNNEFVAMEEILAEDFKKMIACLEWLIEQKADCDEVADGLRDKINTAHLQGIPHGSTFEIILSEFSRRLQSCSGKFKKQRYTWSNIISDLTELLAKKVMVTELLELENFMKSSFKKLQQQLYNLEIVLGIPKATIIIKHISRHSVAGPSTVPAVVEPSEKQYSRPIPSPALSIHEEPVEEEPCLATVRIPGPPEIREHICKRWVGGSHTMVTEHTTHENVAPSLQQKTPTKQYAATGVDGRTYVLEEDLQQCIECNEILSHMYEELPLDQAGSVMTEVGGGDQNLVDDNQDKKV